MTSYSIDPINLCSSQITQQYLRLARSILPTEERRCIPTAIEEEKEVY
jgi:hypothetical protein